MKLIKKLANISLTAMLCLGCIGLTACNKPNNTTNTNTSLTLSQTTQICNSTLGDIISAIHIPYDSYLNQSVSNQTSHIGIAYSEYTSYISPTAYNNAIILINNVNEKYELFKCNMLDLNTTYQFEIVNDDTENLGCIYIRIETSSKNINFSWALTESPVDEYYNKSMDFQSMTIHLDSNLKWTEIELIKYEENQYGTYTADAEYYHITKSTSSDRNFDNYTSASSDYQYIDINNILHKSITLDCSSDYVLTKHQAKAKDYINSLQLTNAEKWINLFDYEIEHHGAFNIEDI